MFLYKRKSGYYYIIYRQDNGKRTSISTHSKYKSDAIKFLTQFKDKIIAKEQQRVIPITLKEFKEEYLFYSVATHTPKTTHGIKNSFTFLLRYLGNINLSDITKTKMENYLQQRKIKSAYSLYIFKNNFCFLVH